jgi:hypothetical protein
MEKLLELLRSSKPLRRKRHAKQYLVVTFENFAHLRWIGNFATWDYRTSEGSAYQVVPLPDRFRLDTSRGVVLAPASGRSLAVQSADILTEAGARRLRFGQGDRAQAPHLVLHMPSGRHFFMDDRAYASPAVQLLLTDPGTADWQKYQNYFKLIYDDFPYVRAYEILP